MEEEAASALQILLNVINNQDHVEGKGMFHWPMKNWRSAFQSFHGQTLGGLNLHYEHYFIYEELEKSPFPSLSTDVLTH